MLYRSGCFRKTEAIVYGYVYICVCMCVCMCAYVCVYMERERLIDYKGLAHMIIEAGESRNYTVCQQAENRRGDGAVPV